MVKEGKVYSPDFGELTRSRIGRICKDTLGAKRTFIWVNGSSLPLYTWTSERYTANCKQYQITQEDVEQTKTLL
jgi:hypothetical protein